MIKIQYCPIEYLKDTLLKIYFRRRYMKIPTILRKKASQINLRMFPAESLPADEIFMQTKHGAL